MKVAIVNVTQSARKSQPEPVRKEATEKSWPLRDDQAAQLDDIAYVVGVRRGIFMGAWPVTGNTNDGVRVDFEASAPLPEHEAAVGQPVPSKWTWSRGEGWPLKIDTDASLSDFPTATPVAQEVRLGEYLVILGTEGGLTVKPPRGGTVSILTK